MVSLTVLTACLGESTSDTEKPKNPGETRVENDKLFATVPERTLDQSIKMYMGGANHKFDEKSYVKAAKKAFMRDDFNSAILLASEAIKINPRSEKAYYYRGRAKYDSMEGNDQEVLQDLEKAIALGIDSDDAYRIVATIYDTKKEHAKALEILSRGITNCTDPKQLYRTRASLYVSLDQPQKALLDYDHLIQESPRYSRIYAHRGQLHESMGNYEKALLDYSQAAKWDSGRDSVRVKPITLKLKASLLAKLDRYEEALKVLDEAQKDDRMDDELHRLKGDAHAALKEYDKAIEEYNWAIDLAPQFSRPAYEARSKVYDKLGKKDLAAKDRQAAKRLKAAPAEKPVY